MLYIKNAAHTAWLALFTRCNASDAGRTKSHRSTPGQWSQGNSIVYEGLSRTASLYEPACTEARGLAVQTSVSCPWSSWAVLPKVRQRDPDAWARRPRLQRAMCTCGTKARPSRGFAAPDCTSARLRSARLPSTAQLCWSSRPRRSPVTSTSRRKRCSCRCARRCSH